MNSQNSSEDNTTLSAPTSEKSKSPDQRAWLVDAIVAFCMVILAIATYLWQARSLNPSTTQLDTVLFSSLEFMLTVGFTWFSTRAISRNEFEQNLKQFAISAYRRIADIEQIVQRLQTQVDSMIADSEADQRSNLPLIRAIAADTLLVVRSSIADWADVIGDELLTIEKIKRLEQNKDQLTSSSTMTKKQFDDSLQQLNEQISRLQSTLPANLKYRALTEEKLSTTSVNRAKRWIAKEHVQKDGFPITVAFGSDFQSEVGLSTVRPSDSLIISTVHSEGIGGLKVVDKDNRIVGMVRNDIPLDYSIFARALLECFPIPIVLEVIGVVSADKESGWQKPEAYVSCKVTGPAFLEVKTEKPSSAAQGNSKTSTRSTKR